MDQLIRVILPLKLDWLPTYKSVEPCRVGQRVVARMGRREYVGVVSATDVTPDIDLARIQHIITADTGLPDVLPTEIALWEFVASYYMCTIGEVYKAAYPGLKTQSEEVSAAILERLHARLEKRNEALLKKHNAAVTARLVAERDALASQIAVLESRRGKSSASQRTAVPAPLVIIGDSRREKYIEVLHSAMADCSQALVLTPDTAFSDSLEKCLSPVFGESLRVFNSTRTAVQRRRIADDLRAGEPIIVLGTRSAVFLPFRDLSLIIVDDEHDSSFKQDEPAPRYNGRDTALALAKICNARVILGSDCPSLETRYNCKAGKFTVATCSKDVRAESGCEVIDIPAERRKNGMSGAFSYKLVEAVRAAGGPVILIRRWEKAEDIESAAASLFPGQDIRIMTLAELKAKGAEGVRLIGVLQADALVPKDDFRADEKAAQLVAMLSSMAPQVVLQTAVPERFSVSRSADELLDERREFNFPPYTRLVEVRRSGTGETVSRHFLRRGTTLATEKARLRASLPSDCYLDVDPL